MEARAEDNSLSPRWLLLLIQRGFSSLYKEASWFMDLPIIKLQEQ